MLSADQLRTIIDNPVDTLAGLPDALHADVVQAYRQGFRDVFVLLAALAAFSFVVAAALLKHRQLDREDDKALKDQGKQFVQELKDADAKRRRAGRPKGDATDEKDVARASSEKA